MAVAIARAIDCRPVPLSPTINTGSRWCVAAIASATVARQPVLDPISPWTPRPEPVPNRPMSEEARRLLVVDEDYRSFGLSGEIAAIVAETDPTMLTKPVSRLAVPDVPIPYSRPLEYGILPTREKISAAVKDLLA